MMTLEELPCLEDFSVTDLVKKSTIHVWATEVTLASPLTEARNLMNELLDMVKKKFIFYWRKMIGADHRLRRLFSAGSVNEVPLL